MLTDRERILIELTVTETDLLDLEPGQVGLASFDAIDGIEYPVRIISVSRVPSVEQGVVTYPVEALILAGDEIAQVAADRAVLGGHTGGLAPGASAAELRVTPAAPEAARLAAAVPVVAAVAGSSASSSCPRA